MFAVRQNGRLLVSQLDVFRGGPEIGSGNMMNRPRGPPKRRSKQKKNKE